LITIASRIFTRLDPPDGLSPSPWRDAVKRLLASLVSAAFGFSSASSRATFIWHDAFDYAPGSAISSAGSPSWYQYATVTDPAVAAGSLSYPGLPAGLGANSVLFTGTGNPYTGIAMRGLDAVYTSGTLYYSLTLQVTGITTADWGGSANWLTGSFMLGFNQEASGALAQGDVAAPLLIRTGDPNNTSGSADSYQGFQLGTGVTAASATRAFDATHTYAPGTTLFLVLSYTFVAGADNDVARLYVNPTPGSVESASTPVVTVTGVADVINNQIQAIFLRNNSVEPAGALIDDVRIGTTWTDVTPPGQADSPSLRILPAATNVQLRWPVDRRGFVLETITNLASGGSWQAATNNITVAGSDFLVVLDGAGTGRFFRLRCPGSPGTSVESVHFGFNASYPAMTDGLRLSQRTGPNWWSLNTTRQNPENGADIPYAYHDGYVEYIGATNSPSFTPAEAALRWHGILNGQGDSWTGASPATVGHPSIILLDEVTTNFKDTQQGPALREALRIHLTQYGGSRDDIVAYLMRSLSLAATPSLYTNLIFCANNYLRYVALEVYVSHQGFITGTDPDHSIGLTDDAYLAFRMAQPIKRWADAGTSPFRMMPVLASSNFATYSGYAKPFQKFLNRQFWFLANGWYDAGHTSVDENIKVALRNGVGTYTWNPGTGVWQLNSAELSRDGYHEEYLRWYCVEGHLDPHPDGVDAR